MHLFNFSKNEIERLYQIREVLRNEHESLPYIQEITPTTTVKEMKQLSDEFLPNMKKYHEKFDTYKYQIFPLVAENDWEERLEEWKRNILSTANSPYYYRYQLYALFVWVNNIIPGPLYSTGKRIFFALIDEFGYEKAIETIKIFTIPEKNVHLKSEFEEFIADDVQISPYKEELHDIIRDKNLFHRLNVWTDKLAESGYTKENIINMLQTSSLVLDGDKTNEIVDKERLINLIIDYVEVIEAKNID